MRNGHRTADVGLKKRAEDETEQQRARFAFCLAERIAEKPEACRQHHVEDAVIDTIDANAAEQEDRGV
ncbi:hypothetical protein SHLA_8c000210 [Shinella sp. DD12]|nr:hypothetical protein SHLA_8c000210 [Shinella sp. DD12]